MFLCHLGLICTSLSFSLLISYIVCCQTDHREDILTLKSNACLTAPLCSFPATHSRKMSNPLPAEWFSFHRYPRHITNHTHPVLHCQTDHREDILTFKSNACLTAPLCSFPATHFRKMSNPLPTEWFSFHRYPHHITNHTHPVLHCQTDHREDILTFKSNACLTAPLCSFPATHSQTHPVLHCQTDHREDILKMSNPLPTEWFSFHRYPHSYHQPHSSCAPLSNRSPWGYTHF